MPEINTPGVAEPEVAALRMRAKTKAFPDDQTISGPRRYDQCVELPGKLCQEAQGQGDAYTD